MASKIVDQVCIQMVKYHATVNCPGSMTSLVSKMIPRPQTNQRSAELCFVPYLGHHICCHGSGPISEVLRLRVPNNMEIN